MSFVTEPRNLENDSVFVERLLLREAAATLTEVSIAALTTEPQLLNIGRSLITLARYYAHKTTPPAAAER